MSEPQPSPSADVPSRGSEFEALKAGVKRQPLSKPVSIIALGLALAVVAAVVFLQHAPSALTLEVPDARYELLPNQGLTAGVPIAIQLGPLTLFEISDPMAGGAGATRAKQVVESLNEVVGELAETPGRVITIDTGADGGMPRILQKETADAEVAQEIVAVTSDDMILSETEDAKLLARIWAERLTDSLRLLLFGSPPEFSRDTEFGAALDTLHGNAVRESGTVTTDALMKSYEDLPSDLQEALKAFPPLPPPAELDTGAPPS